MVPGDSNQVPERGISSRLSTRSSRLLPALGPKQHRFAFGAIQRDIERRLMRAVKKQCTV